MFVLNVTSNKKYGCKNTDIQITEIYQFHNKIYNLKNKTNKAFTLAKIRWFITPHWGLNIRPETQSISTTLKTAFDIYFNHIRFNQ